ncbi:unnamed protein product [Ambrosiozyma monospora]|uniref:Unnamed protein product n=1 Tax=Ambrosiozyma monospora TaxID=43982 RepID=A0ACB5SXF0_AMBMO|nr:unnamed protein product [Ambrosiozyma monospora]
MSSSLIKESKTGVRDFAILDSEDPNILSDVQVKHVVVTTPLGNCAPRNEKLNILISQVMSKCQHIVLSKQLKMSGKWEPRPSKHKSTVLPTEPTKLTPKPSWGYSPRIDEDEENLEENLEGNLEEH